MTKETTEQDEITGLSGRVDPVVMRGNKNMIKLFIHKSKVPSWIERAPVELFFMQPVTVVWRWNGVVHVAPLFPIIGGIFKDCVIYVPNPDKLDDVTISGAPTVIWNTWSMPKIWIKKIFSA